MVSDLKTHVRIVTPVTAKNFRSHDQFAFLESASLSVSLVAIDSGPTSIESAFDAAVAGPSTIARLIEAEGEGVDAIVIDCMVDPALEAARECVSIPVLGTAQMSMHLAACLSQRFTILTVMSRMQAQFEKLATLYGLGNRLASVRAVDVPVLKLATDTSRTAKLLSDAAYRSVEQDGADCIIFGCTGFLGHADAVRRDLTARGYDVPVIDPVPTAVRIAEALCNSGLSHSKLTFPFPPRKPISGYSELSMQSKGASS
jgi:allantoin racemase